MLSVIPACRESFLKEGCQTDPRQGGDKSRHDKNSTKDLKYFVGFSEINNIVKKRKRLLRFARNNNHVVNPFSVIARRSERPTWQSHYVSDISFSSGISSLMSSII